MSKRFSAWPLLLCLLISSCAALPAERSREAERVALEAGFQKEMVPAGPFVLTTFHRLTQEGGPLRVYVEGDGYAWVTPTRVSGNPTPREPMVLSLAAEDSAGNVVYLARPCQYTSPELQSAWDSKYWTDGRFSEPVVQAMNDAVSQYVRKTRAKSVELIGYSGGAAIAVLIAARREDVTGLRTLAGNLHPDAVNAAHGLGPLRGSLNPIDYAGRVKDIPMRHWIGTDDTVIPASVVESFAERAGDASHNSITEVRGATHTQGWQDRWREMLSLPLHAASLNNAAKKQE